MTIVMDVQSCMKATLLAIIILSVVTWLSHMYSCIKTFMESLPSVVSAVIAPRCLFIFSNIIIVFLLSESKLSRRRRKLMKTDDAPAPPPGDEHMLQSSHQKLEDVVLAEVLLPMIIGESKQEQENNKMAMVVYEEKDAPVGIEGVHMLTAVDNELESSVVNEGVRVNQYEEKGNQLVLQKVDEVHEEVEEVGYLEFEQREEVSGDVDQEHAAEDLEERDLPADELNRRVEDFIARFNMERQLEEAKMLVCCY